MKKICILTSVHIPFDVRIFFKEAKSLANAGYDVTLIAQHDNDEVVDGIKIISLRLPRNRIERMTKTAWSVFWKALKVDADIYHLHDPELMPIGLILKSLGKKIIYDMHENLPKQIKNKHWINPRLRQFLSMAVYWSERVSLKGIPVIFAEHSYRKDYPWVKEFETILNMPLVNQLLCIEPDASALHGFSIGYLGRVGLERGSIMIIEALKILKDRGITPRYDCIGPITESHKHDILKRCEQYRLTDVAIHGYMPAYKGWEIIKRCNVGLALLHPIPNYIESYPTKIFEYMALGIPVVASDFPLYREVVEGNDCGLCVDPLQPESIAEAIGRLVMNPEVARRMGENGRQAVMDKYNWSVEEKKLCEFYKKLLGTP